MVGWLMRWTKRSSRSGGPPRPPRDAPFSSLATAVSLARRATVGCTERTHRQSAAEETAGFGPNFRIRQKEQLSVCVAVVASLVQTSDPNGTPAAGTARGRR